MSIAELEREYKQSRERLLRGEIDEDVFKATVEKLRFEDSLDRQWKLGWYTGRWYRYEEGEWIQDEPQERGTSQAGRSAAMLLPDRGLGLSRRFFSRWLVAFLTALLLLTTVVLVRSLKADWWDGIQGTATSTINALSQDLGQVADTEPSSSPSRSKVSPVTTDRRTDQVQQIPTVIATPFHNTAPRPNPVLPAPLPPLDGRIYFSVYDDHPERQTYDIYAVQLDTGERQLVVSQASQPAISPDGTRLAYRSWGQGQQGISVLGLETGSSSLWVDAPFAARPAWSPDGQRLAFAEQPRPDEPWHIVQASATGLEPVELQGTSILGQMPVWLAGGRLAYEACPASRCGLYTVGTEGTPPSRWTAGKGDTAPAAAPNGERLAFMSNLAGNWDIYLIDDNQNGEPARLTGGDAIEGLPAWSPDGQWLAFVSDRTGAWAVWIMRPDGSQQHRLFSIGGPLEGQVTSISAHFQLGWTWETLSWGP
ncbi:MAG: hypothetical protein ACK2UC_05070 [Anaerolineae bacterium]|jgi:hypothetical protein